MNLSFVFDVIIGLTFIYLTLSLLASEIQEILTTIFQWRAKHLKESVEILIAGGKYNNSSEEIEYVRKLVNTLYNNPLIENINQEAKGWLENIPRWLIWKFGDLSRWILGSITRRSIETSFGDSKRSAPSYIPSETFATTILETLQIPTIVRKFSEVKLDKFKQLLLSKIKFCLIHGVNGTKVSGIDEKCFAAKIEEIGEPARSLVSLFRELEKEYSEIIADFKNNKTTLEVTIKRMQESLDKYISATQPHFPTTMDTNQIFENHMLSLKHNLFKGNNLDILLREMKPSLTQVVDAINKNSKIYEEILDEIKDKDQETYQIIKQALDGLPKSVIDSISALAHRAQSRVEIVETDMNQLRQEIELWFDRSMERASGVYKRNAKGVAFLIGLFIAFAVNADTFHIVSRLSKDTVVRNAITQSAAQVSSNCPASSQLDCISKEVNQTLETASIPLGWSSYNVSQQQQEELNVYGRYIPFLTRTLGWILTGIAITMGAPFWFELLGKFVNVRNAGSRPASSANNQTTTNAQTPAAQSGK